MRPCWCGAGWAGAAVPAAEAAGQADAAAHQARQRAAGAGPVAVEHVFAAQKCRLGLVIRSVGVARATTKLGLANLVTNMRRLVWFETYKPAST